MRLHVDCKAAISLAAIRITLRSIKQSLSECTYVIRSVEYHTVELGSPADCTARTCPPFKAVIVIIRYGDTIQAT
jgi:hypothetical protein